MWKQHVTLVALFALVFSGGGAVYAQDTDGSHGAQPRILLPLVQSGADDTAVDQQVVRVYLTSEGQLPEAAHELDLFEEATTNGYAVALASAAEIARLQAQGIRVEVDAERTTELMTALAQVQTAQASGVAAINTIPGFTC